MSHTTTQGRRRRPLRLLIIATILVILVLVSLPELSLDVYAAFLICLLGIWILSLWLLKNHSSSQFRHATEEEKTADLTLRTKSSEYFGQLPVASTGLRGTLLRHPLFSYFSIAYAIKFIVLIPYSLAAWGVISGDWTAAFVLATFGPFVAGTIMVYLTEGRDGLTRLKNRVRQWRIGWKWLLFIFAGIPAIVMFGIVVQPGAFVGFLGISPILLVSYPFTYVAVWFGGGGLNEEVGWRGFALPRMQSRYGPLWGTMFLGVVHCFWHFEEFLTPAQGGGPGTGWTPFLVNLPMFLLVVIAFSIIITWIFNRTRGSLFAVISAHASVDTPQATFIPLFPAVGALGIQMGFGLGLAVVALLIVILTRGRLGYEPNQGKPSSPEIEAQPIR